MRGASIDLDEVSYVREARTILGRITWAVDPDQRWVVLGPNGCGKTTLIRICAGYEHASSGSVHLLGSEVGRCDLRQLRRRIGFVSAAMADLVRPNLAIEDVVMTARNAALEPWWHTYSDDDRAWALECLQKVGLGWAAGRTFGSMSSGERQRVLIARQLMIGAELLLFDEPSAGLDLSGRESLVDDLARLAATATAPPIVLVTHHVEEIPPGFTHVLLLDPSGIVAAGPLHETLRSDTLSASVGLSVELTSRRGRFSASRR